MYFFTLLPSSSSLRIEISSSCNSESTLGCVGSVFGCALSVNDMLNEGSSHSDSDWGCSSDWDSWCCSESWCSSAFWQLSSTSWFAFSFEQFSSDKYKINYINYTQNCNQMYFVNFIVLFKINYLIKLRKKWFIIHQLQFVPFIKVAFWRFVGDCWVLSVWFWISDELIMRTSIWNIVLLFPHFIILVDFTMTDG